MPLPELAEGYNYYRLLETWHGTPVGDHVEHFKVSPERRAQVQTLKPGAVLALDYAADATFRKAFASVTLHWRKTWHPAQENPSRKRKTKRPGRYSYEIDTTKTAWKTSESLVMGKG